MKRFCFFLLLLPIIATARPAKIYDCFMFMNESSILEIRLYELYPYVDKFVLVESCQTHRVGEAKPFYFELQKERFAPFLDKIIHIKLEEETPEDGWSRENWQRNQIMRGLNGCQPNDIIMISDADEIPAGAVVSKLRQIMERHDRLVFVQKMYRWFLNRTTDQDWAATGVVRYKDLLKLSPQGVRNLAREMKMAKSYSGWHFTSMGGYDAIVEKYHNIVEGSNVELGRELWRKQVDEHRLVPIDDSFPKFVQENQLYLLNLGLID